MKKQVLNTLVATVAAGSAMLAPAALAYEAGDIILRTGIVTVDPQGSSDKVPVTLNGATATFDGVEVDSNSQLGLVGVYMINSYLGLELLAATPFEHDIQVENTNVTAGSTKHLPPTLSVQLFPMGLLEMGDSMWQPYVGVGLNYTAFFDEEINEELNDTVDAGFGLPAGSANASLKLEDSWGVAVEGGLDVNIGESWVVNASVWWIDINTTATIENGGDEISKFDVEIDPLVYMIGVGYKF